MKTDKVITKEQMQSALNEEVSKPLFEKKTAKLFINIKPSELSGYFSVFNMITFIENDFDTMADAASYYNSL